MNRKLTSISLILVLILTNCEVWGFASGVKNPRFRSRLTFHSLPKFIDSRGCTLYYSTLDNNENENTATNDNNIVVDVEDLNKKGQNFMYNWNSIANVNAFINISILLIIGLTVLSKLATVDQGMMRGWTAAEMAIRIPVDNFNSYETVLNAAPVSTKAITSATVYSIGDIIAQKTEGKSAAEFDRLRNLRSLLAGLIGHGPLSHVWYNVSEDVFTSLGIVDQWWSFLPKVAIDQLTWGPFWNNTYILLLGIMQFRNPKAIWEEMKATTIPLIVSGLKLWPLAHCITYGVIPVENRLLWVDLVEILWVTILATAANGTGGAHGSAVVESASDDEPTNETV